MTRARYIFTDDAAAELVDASHWYEKERAGLGQDLVDEVVQRIEDAIESPGLGSLVTTAGPTRQVRRYRLKRFASYAIIVSRKGDDEPAMIVAVEHSSRRPGYWRDRL